MNTFKIILAAISASLWLLMSIHADEAYKERHVYLTYHKDLILHTTDKDIQFFTKEDPQKQKDNALLDLHMIIPKKWTKEIYLNLHVYSTVDGKKTLIGYTALKNMGKWTGALGGKNHDFFSFALTKKHLSASYLFFETETESFTVYLRKKK